MTDSLRPGFPLRINSNLYGEQSPAPSPGRHQKIPEPEESEYMLRWGEHDTQVINIFHQLCQENQLTDVTLSTETRSFQAHKLILSACSPYFRNLFINNPCKHPTVFFKDISEEHMKLLMEYMYRGSISVKQNDLTDILKTASSLQIHGLTQAEPPKDTVHPPRPLIVDDQNTGKLGDSSVDKFQQVETGSSHSGHSAASVDSGSTGSTKRRSEGRKSSKPKKLRLNEDRESMTASPMYPMMSSPRFPIISEEKEIDRNPAQDEVIKPQMHTPDDNDNIAVSDDEESELVIDQPVDFSTGKGEEEPEGSKQKEEAPRGFDRLPGSAMMGNWEEQLANLARSAQRHVSKEAREEQGSSGEENTEPVKEHPQISLSATTMGIDIASQLKNHFLASLPTQSYAWLNSMAGGAPPNTPSNMVERDTRERTPLGGIKTGEIGPNGKPAVECEECGKTLADPSSLYRHRKIHTGDKPHKCPYCDKRFIQRYNMKQHIKTHRLEDPDMKASGLSLADIKPNGINIDLTPKGHESSQGPKAMNHLKLSMPGFDHGLNMSH